MESVQLLARRLSHNLERVIVGKRREIRLLLAALFADRHVLIEDVPGTGKTTLVKSLARSIGASFARIQFTPDLLPSDVTGVPIFDRDGGEFRFQPGPVFSQVLLADEINRASPKTQSSLLEAMEERQVTVDGRTYPLPSPFLVLATQNSVEYEGTFPLPEAQLDRFALRLTLGYPTADEEQAMLLRFSGADPFAALRPVTDPEETRAAQEMVRRVYVDPQVTEYVVRLVAATRRHEEVALGASPRCSLFLLQLAQSLAAIEGRDFVLPDDVKELAEPVIAHRLILKPEVRWRDRDAGQVVAEIVSQTRVPVAVRHA